MKHVLIPFFFVLTISSQVLGWGANAHKAAAKIAWAYLDPQTRAAATEILNGTSMEYASVWADSARANREWGFTIWYHFEKAPDNYTYLDNLRRQDERQRKLGGLIEALYIAEDTLKNPSASDIDRENALKFTIHFIGDIHQPLHTGRIEDNSGNKIPVLWRGYRTNLHSVWDSQMINLAHREILEQGRLTGDPAQAYADYLMKKFKDFQTTPELFARYDDWMHESMEPRADAYTYKDESEEEYTARFIDVVDQRIFLAGLRIAHVMKRLVHRENSTEPLTALRRAIVNIVGDFTEFVSLRPRDLRRERH